MKKMKKIKYILFSLLSLSLVFSCVEDDNDALTGNAVTGGILNISTTAIGYVVGNDGTYTASGSVYQGDVQTTSIDVYKSFTNSQTGASSNEVLFMSIPVSDTKVGAEVPFQFSFKYEDLIQDLTLDGSPLPSNDAELNIGDSWNLRFASTTSEGNVNFNGTSTKVSVGTRFAGLYRTLNAEYYRIGVLTYTTGDWPAETLIESVDATTYRVVEYFGAEAFNGNEWYFQIDENDIITYPEKTPSGDPQLGNGEPFISCTTAPQEMTNVPCGDSTNYVERDDVNGADKLYMSYGYLTGGAAGNAREFYQVLEKIVD